jgi:hypothetical protein
MARNASEQLRLDARRPSPSMAAWGVVAGWCWAQSCCSAGNRRASTGAAAATRGGVCAGLTRGLQPYRHQWASDRVSQTSDSEAGALREIGFVEGPLPPRSRSREGGGAGGRQRGTFI